jgi:hypothetical protein
MDVVQRAVGIKYQGLESGHARFPDSLAAMGAAGGQVDTAGQL